MPKRKTSEKREHKMSEKKEMYKRKSHKKSEKRGHSESEKKEMRMKKRHDKLKMELKKHLNGSEKDLYGKLVRLAIIQSGLTNSREKGNTRISYGSC